jgi:transcriptional regulator with PAS, ATPase and Fis domain
VIKNASVVWDENGKGHAMRQVFAAIKAASSSDATILVQEESGTGKEADGGLK